ncbi:MAG: DUF1801 domain-containing protein [Lactobacillus sp.]|jgi:uncharacterized protein YdhG (YjbR/CyaY superfamily)|nr:DUF1801 domain-containing protein [Lactobacillus sp.]
MPMRPKVTDIDAYLKIQTHDAQLILKNLRQLITQTLPAAQETIKYGLPFFVIDKRYVSLAAYKAHISVAISEDLTPDQLQSAKAAGYATGQKRLNIAFDQPIPEDLVRAIVLDIK